MNKDKCFYLGKITKPFSYKGELVMFLDVDEPTDYLDLKYVLIETKTGLVPYFIETMNMKNDKAVVSFAGITVDESQSLIGKSLYLPLEMLPPLEGDKFYFHEVIGFTVIDEEKGDIGFIETVLDYPAQAVFQIKFGEKEILMPVIDKVIVKLDREQKTLYIKAPDGLIDLYLN